MTEEQKREIEALIWDLHVTCKDYGYGKGIQRGGNPSRLDEAVANSKKDANKAIEALFDCLGMTENKFEID